MSIWPYWGGGGGQTLNTLPFSGHAETVTGSKLCTFKAQGPYFQEGDPGHKEKQCHRDSGERGPSAPGRRPGMGLAAAGGVLKCGPKESVDAECSCSQFKNVFSD